MFHMKNFTFSIYARLILCVEFLVALSACSTISERDLKDKPVWRFGVVKLEVDKSGNGARKVDVMTIGVWSGVGGFGAGYNNSRTLSLNNSCRLVFIVSNDEQAKSLKLFLQESDIFKGDHICIKKN